MTNPTTSVFYRVRGQGVRDHEWTKTSQLPVIPPTPPSKPIKPLAIPPSPQYSIAPTVRIFPSISSAPSVAVTRPLVSPLTANPISSTRNPPRPLTATLMIANPTHGNHPNVPSQTQNLHATPVSPRTSAANNNSHIQRSPAKSPSLTATQRASADKQAIATSSALDTLLRDRKRRVPSSSKLPPLPKPIPKTNTQPPAALATAGTASASTQPQPSGPKRTSNVPVGVKKEMTVQRVLESSPQTFAVGSNERRTLAAGSKKGIQVEKPAHPQSSNAKNTSQPVVAKGPAPGTTAEMAANADEAAEATKDEGAGKFAKEGRNEAPEKRGTKNMTKDDTHVSATNEAAPKENQGVIDGGRETSKTRFGDVQGRSENQGVIDGGRETGKTRFGDLQGSKEGNKRQGEPRDDNGVKKNLEPAGAQAARPRHAARGASDEDHETAIEGRSREKKRKRTSHGEDGERSNVVREETPLNSLTGFIDVLAKALSMCNTQEGINTEQTGRLRREVRAFIQIKDQGEQDQLPESRHKLQPGREKPPQQLQKVSASDSVQKPMRPEPGGENRDQTGAGTSVVEPVTGKGEITASRRIDQRRERLEGVHADMFATEAATRLADISKEYKDLAKKAGQLLEEGGGEKSHTDEELIQHVAELNAKAEAMGFVTRMSNYFLTRVGAGSDGGPDASTLKTALNALRDIMQWIGWLVEGVNELSLRCRQLPREHSLVQQFATVMISLISENSGQARNDGIMAVLRDIKKVFPSSKEFPGEGNDGKPYFGRRKRVGESVRFILPAFGKICQWAQKIRTSDPTQAASARDDDAKTAVTAVRSSAPAPTRSGTDVTSEAKPDSEAAKQTSKGADTRADVQIRKGQSTAGGNAKRPGMTSRSGATELPIRSERNRVSDPATSSKNGTNGMAELKIPRRPIRRTEGPSSPKVTGPSTNVTSAAGRTGMAPLRSAPVTGVEGRPRTTSGMIDPAALVRAKLVDAGNFERQRAQEERRQFGGSEIVRRGSGPRGSRNGVARPHKRRKVTFANDQELVQGSAGTNLQSEEIECLFTDGYDLLGCRNKLQEGAVQERASQLSRGSMMALYGYLRAEFSRLKEQAETNKDVAPSEAVDLALTPAALRQVERIIQKPSWKDDGGESSKKKKT